ncbi:hypothetical protein BJV77DRAFT_1072911 [Russula vinacea]|nr:hypothetical protein BJV77DRAFT_1072911 [Russula vinacea]
MFVFDIDHNDGSYDRYPGDSDNNDDDNEKANFTPGDSLGKVLAFVKQIQMSPQARMFFKSSCSQVGIKPLELLLWICT